MPNRYLLVQLVGPVGVGVTGSYRAQAGVIVKDNSVVPYCVANEYIASTIGRFLGLPIPPCGILRPSHAGASDYFASLDFNIDGHAMPPIDPSSCFSAMPDSVTGLILFDALIANSDRHAGNLEADLGHPARLSIFDHSHSLYGIVAGSGIARLNAMQNRLAITGGAMTGGNRHCFLDVIDDDRFIAKWLERVRGIPDFFIDDTVDEIGGLGPTAAELARVKQFLKDRRDDLWDIFKANTLEFTSLMQWPLLH